ncbi:hypothetical protein CLAFUW4_07047 [Fulvia fulva]|uniref:Uncharacterized protein n=1 Tax=Passalora fulva TaxID=5499 RepID=A0A9Q8UQ69_PASFU|nr:uncharacterized protein CLAFUR5_07184 [Fulvia fulva]KAK4622306.1 hypothetical protein CLAFUR4_07056 [Fulvia fulva]KAK4622900.1 hypothetical protein CLAFUR0_07054 [Fulvia fulva]UJO18580.1 hypothetical protein CLAFUR5_07184 [Fulvia fulva]WPV15795.1 hypothetical protein CLAFUW4_07047 [Fulvia fulva]WPV30832.1 hypothetical protein CLAFUW7_07047 [Fulvia fulva]
MGDGFLEPDTAPEQRSVWKDINRKVLKRTTLALFKKQHVVGRQTYAMPFQRMYDPSYSLPLNVEMGLAGDFAFIAACEPQVAFVTAAAIEQTEDEPSLLVKLAANEGIAVIVREKSNQLFEVLRQHAKRG